VGEEEFEKWVNVFGKDRICARDTESNAISSCMGRLYRIFNSNILRSEEETIIKEILNIVDQLKEEGVSSDELLRAKRPMITSITDKIRTNQYWISSVLALSSRYPQQLEWPKTILSDFSSTDEKDLTELARKYLDNSRGALARAVPSEFSHGKAVKTTTVENEK